MSNFLHKLFRPRNPDSARARLERLKKLDGEPIKYVTERSDENGAENVVGKSGAIIVRDGELLIFSSRDVVFRAKLEEIVPGELMSGDGVILTAPDIVTGRNPRTVIAYFSYYRK
jgi:hypothetical protein